MSMGKQIYSKIGSSNFFNLRKFGSTNLQTNFFKNNLSFDDFNSKIDGYLDELFPEDYNKNFDTFSDGNVDIQAIKNTIFEPGRHLLTNGGKRWRPYLGYLFSKTMIGSNSSSDFQKNLNESQIFYISALGETLHNATLIMDDIQDASIKRRGLPCVHITYGVDRAIAAGLGLFY